MSTRFQLSKILSLRHKLTLKSNPLSESPKTVIMSDPNRPVTGYPAPNPTHPPNPPNPPPPSTTAYPYNPPPPQSYPYYPHAHPYYNQQRATFLRRIFAIIIAAFIITGTIIFIVWLILRPHLPEIRVDSLTLTSPFNLTSDRLSASWDLKLTAKNPNGKITLSYEHIQAAVFYRRESLADTYLPPFEQGKKNETAIFASFAAASSYVDGHMVDEMNNEKGKSNGNVGFNVVMVAEVRLTAGAWRARRRFLKAYCGDLVISVLGNGSSKNNGLMGGPRQCRVGM